MVAPTREIINKKEAVITLDENVNSAYNAEYTAIDVTIQDQYSDIVDFYLMRELLTLEIATPPTRYSKDITVTDATGVNVGEYLGIQDGERNYQGKILAINTNTLTMDTPFDYEYGVTSQIISKTPDLNVNGSVTPVIARLGPVSGVKWDITRFLGNMILTSSGADNLFGNLTALTNGVVFRKNGDTITNNLFNAKTNGDLSLRMFDVSYTDRSTPSQSYGLRFRRSFNGADKNGVIIRLDGDNNDEFQLVIQDDLTGLTSFRIAIQGHTVQG